MLAHTFYGAGGSGGRLPLVNFGVRKKDDAAPTRPVNAVCALADPSTTASQMMAPTESMASTDATTSVRVMSCMSGIGLPPWRVPKKCKTSCLLFGRGRLIGHRRCDLGWPFDGLSRHRHKFG
jgi:hypothetical protein